MSRRVPRMMLLLCIVCVPFALAACGSNKQKAKPAVATSATTASGGDTASAVVPAPDRGAVNAELTKWGWTIPEGLDPNLSCTDDSYAKAVKSGITYGTYELPPYFSVDASTKTATGHEWDLLKTAAAYVGITDVRYKVAPYDSLIPALNAGRVDIFPAHETKERIKAIGFSAPVYWYGPVIAVPSGNPGKINDFTDLARKGVSVGVVKGSAAQIYMDNVKGKIVPFADQNTELAALSSGRQPAALEDSITLAEYAKKHPDGKVTILKGKSLDPKTLYDLGYGYFEFGLRKSDCSLNQALSMAVGQLRANGVYAKILAKYGLAGLATVTMPGMGS